MGRKKYEQWLTEEGLLKLEGWARQGLTDAQIAHNCGVGADTIGIWRKKYPQINDALKKGKEVVDIEVENALLKAALGYEYEETKTVIEQLPDGTKKQHIEKTKRYSKPDSTAQIFWLKNRKPDEWRRTATLYKEKTEAETAKTLAEKEKVEMETRLARNMEEVQTTKLDEYFTMLEREVDTINEHTDIEENLHGQAD